MLFNKWFCWAILITMLVLLMTACTPKTVVEYRCPFGVGWLTANDYQIISDPAKISDKFADWLLQTNMYCEDNNGTVSL